MKILGVEVDSIDRSQLSAHVTDFLSDKKQHMVVTPNPEMLVAAHYDRNLQKILNSADLHICDGYGIQLVTSGAIRRLPGVDAMVEICRTADALGRSIYLLGGSGDAATGTAAALQSLFPTLRIVGTSRGPIVSEDGRDLDPDDDTVPNIILAAPDVLFVAFGHGKQEYWISHHLRDFPSVKIAMGVGGSFDFLSGKVKRAPVFMRESGLEWFWRLLMQPWRIGRIWTATIIFLCLYAFNKY